MKIITMRTDKPEAELGLFDGEAKVDYLFWPAHRELAETIHSRIITLLKKQDLGLQDIEGIVIFRGPGSFTGLRIGISVANALADSINKPVVGSQGDDWISQGINRLLAGENQQIVLPEYGAPPNISQPKK